MSDQDNRIRLTSSKGFWISVAVVAVIAFLLGSLLTGSEPIPQSAATGQTAQVAQVWTCSMHPQIKLPKPGKCPICFMDLIPLNTTDSGELGPRQLRMSETARQLAQIETSPVIRGNATAEVRLYGKLAIDESRLATITARFGGRIDKLYVNTTGEIVKRGEKLADLYSPELLSARKELRQALISLAAVSQSNSDILKSTSEATVSSAREKLRLLGLSGDQISKLETDSQEGDHIAITAPSNGTVIEKMVVEGDYVETGMALFKLADLSKMWVVMEAYETDLPSLSIGEQISFGATAFPGETFTAKISFINPTFEPMTRTASVRAVVENSGGRLKPDMYVTATTLGQSSDSPDNLLVPASAVLITGRRAVVYVDLTNADGPLFEGREIEVGSRVGDSYVVLSGLSEGDHVVTNGAFKLDSELQIQAKPSMMAPEAGLPAPGHQHEAVAIEPVKISNAARTALTPLYEKYFAFQMALASDDLAAARAAVVSLQEATISIDLTLFAGSAHDDLMNFISNIQDQAEAAAKATDIESARGAFFYLSESTIALHDKFGHGTGTNFYLAHCPMARENKGADWLQTVDTVYNSFYGAAMLRCGEIRKTLRSEN